MSGFHMKEWNQQRTLQTTLLSVIEVNPNLDEEEMKAAFESPREGPKRKAIRLTPKAYLTVAQLKKQTDTLLHRSFPQDTSEMQDFAFSGKLGSITDVFFVNDPPIIETAKGDVMCWKTTFEDDTGRIDVKVWGKACYELFHVTVDKMRELWEEGNEKPEEQEKILTTLNAHLDAKVIRTCKADIWSYGYK